MRAIACLLLLVFVLVPDGMAVTIQASLGSGTVSGEIVGIAPDRKPLSVKIKQASGVELEIEIQRLEPLSRDKVFAWMGQVARMNGVKMPHLKFSPFKQVTNLKSPFRIKDSVFQTSSKSSKIEHVISVLNSSAVVSDGVTVQLLIRQVKTEQSRVNGSTKEALWIADSRSITSLQPKEMQKVVFTPLEESSSKKVTTQKEYTITGASRGSSSNVETQQVKIEVVYVMAFDGAGNLIYFVKM